MRCIAFGLVLHLEHGIHGVHLPVKYLAVLTSACHAANVSSVGDC